MAKNPRGVFEKQEGNGVWWIRYRDTEGRLRREKAGTKAVAIKLYIKRKQEALEGRKLPENLRTQKTTFGKLLDAAIEYSERNTPEGGKSVTSVASRLFGKPSAHCQRIPLLRRPFPAGSRSARKSMTGGQPR